MSAARLSGFTALVTLALALAGCTTKVTERGFDEYLALAPQDTFRSAELDPRLEGFVRIFATLNPDDIADGLDQVYAENFYFNDTFHTFTDRNTLKRYLLGLTSVAQTTVEVLDASVVGDDVLLRWKMNTKGKVWWTTMDIDSVGITHLRFDDEDKIVLHQDYWDGVQGFYGHLPLIGSPIRSIRAKVGTE